VRSVGEDAILFNLEFLNLALLVVMQDFNSILYSLNVPSQLPRFRIDLWLE
jgi:hypothetical protein